ncbi:MAG TPA: Rpn family recombination-promoting nuclease/putative transposase [Nannocystaceae bacterium]|nr:Rpn family recombination-promoting nuclease/putative transposase [Nannocystaceae bacterium]
MTSRPHDALFRSAFEDPLHASAEARLVLPRALAGAIDWRTTRLESGSFIDEALADSQSDLLFSAAIGRRRVLIYLLLEHQSTVDRNMPLRMLSYMVRIWQRYQKEKRRRSLPAIIPLVVVHAGSRRAGPTRMHELVIPRPDRVVGLPELVPSFRIIVDDISAATDAQLRARALAAFPKLVLWLLRESRRRGKLLRGLPQWADAFHAVATAPGGIVAMHRVLRYLDFVLGEQRFERARDILRNLSSATENAVVTYTERVQAESRVATQREILLKQLALKFGALDEEIVDRVRSADPTSIEMWLERFVAATQLDAVFGS